MRNGALNRLFYREDDTSPVGGHLKVIRFADMKHARRGKQVLRLNCFAKQHRHGAAREQHRKRYSQSHNSTISREQQPSCLFLLSRRLHEVIGYSRTKYPRRCPGVRMQY